MNTGSTFYDPDRLFEKMGEVLSTSSVLDVIDDNYYVNYDGIKKELVLAITLMKTVPEVANFMRKHATTDDIIKVLRIAVHKRLNRNHLARALKWDIEIFDEHIFRLNNPSRDLPF